MRFETYSQRDTPDATSGDQFFQGIDMTRDRSLLQPGMLSLGENTRTRTGHVRQRKGTIMPADFNPPSGFGAAHLVGSGVFRNPNGDEVLLVAPRAQEYTWTLQDGKDLYKVNYAGAVTGTNGVGTVELVQAFEKVILLRKPYQGSPNQNLVWDGVSTQTTPGVADSEWEVAALSATGSTLIPGVWNAEPFMDRIIYYNANFLGVSGRDTWYLSDIEDYTSYDSVYQAFRTNPGESDYITRIMSYFRGSVVIFKNQSIHLAELQPSYPVSITQRILNRTIGSIGNHMPLMIGGDVIFLSQPNGFYRLSEVIQDQIQTLPLPISERIQRVIDNINWTATAIFGCSASVDNYAFFGVCSKNVSTSAQLNTILVYDTQRDQWESAGDTWGDATFTFSRLHITNYGGIQRLFAVDYQRGIIYLLYEGIHDELPRGIFSVPFKMETRGYTGDDAVSFKRFGRATIGIKTSDPQITVTAINEGFNEEKVLTPVPITKDRIKFYQHGHADFDPDTDDPLEQKRKDYSVFNNENFVGEDYEALPEGQIVSIPGTVPSADSPQQDSLERFIVRNFGAWCALRIENVSGICEVSNVSVESTRAMNTNRTAA